MQKCRDIADEPDFAWCVPYTLRKCSIILSKVTAWIRKTTQKYGIRIPTSVKHTLALDNKNGNTFWRDALAKELTQVGITFKVLGEEQ